MKTSSPREDAAGWTKTMGSYVIRSGKLAQGNGFFICSRVLELAAALAVGPPWTSQAALALADQVVSAPPWTGQAAFCVG